MMVNPAPRPDAAPPPPAAPGPSPRPDPSPAESPPASALDHRATLAAVVVAGIHVAWTLGGFGGPTVTGIVLRGSLLVAAVSTALACAAVSRRCTDGTRRGWRLLSLTAGCWALSQLLGSVGNVVTGLLPTFPAPHDALAGAAVVLSILGLLAFLGDVMSSAARMRSLLDSLLVAGGALFLAWGLVFERLYRAAGEGPARLLSLAYPVADLVVGVLIFAVARRATAAGRLPWTLLGAAWGLFAAGHWSFAYLQLAGLERAPWVETTSWLGGFLLAALAAVSFREDARPRPDVPRSGSTLGILLPYVPILLAAGLAGARRVDWGAPAFLAVNGAAVMVLLLARQLVFQLENLDHARQLAAEVQRHTADLVRQERHFRSIAQNASDVLTVVDSSGVVRYQSTSITRVLGLAAPDLIGRPLVDLLGPAERRPILPMIAAATPPPATPAVIRTWLRHADGSSRQVEIAVSNLLGDPAVRGFVLSTRDVSERLALEAQLREQAMQDPLTGLGNRILFHDRLEHALARAQRNPEFLAVLMIDLDGFKQVNDSLGHGAGDRLLTEIGRRLADCVRTGDTVCRMGGDEFAVLLERTELEGAAVLAQRIVFRLRAPVEMDGRSIVAQGSVGVALGSTSTASAEELLRNADLAMYAAKAKGKGAYEVFERDMHSAALGRMELESELREALRLRELTLHFQPVIEIPSGRISGAEALVRWNHPKRGMVSPAEFIPVAEQSGLIVDLGRWVLGEACRQAKRFQDAYPTEPPFAVAVNVAARQLTSPWLVEEVRKALVESHLPASSLVLEITEGALMSDVSTIIPALHELRAVGVRLAIDDFGTG